MAGFTRWARIGACALVLALAACAAGDTRRPEPFAVKLIAFNDFHGNLHSPGLFGPARPVGGADYLAAHVARLKASNPLNVVVGAGDSIGATPLVSALFFDEPSVEVLNRIGLEFNAVGNHEFDRGVEHLLRLQRGGCRTSAGAVDPASCRGREVGTPVPFEGARFQWLAANVVDPATGRPLLPAYGTKRFRGVDVAFIGMTLKATPTIVSPSGVAGLAFRDEAQTVNTLVPELRARGIEAIVVLVHEGGRQSGRGEDINGCDGRLAGSAIARIVRRLDDAVDLVVAGHSHAAFNCRLPNAAGRPILVTSANAFGRMLTDVDFTLDPATRDVVSASATNRLVVRDDLAIAPDATVAAIVSGYAQLVAPISNRVVGTLARALPNTRVDRACNMPAGAFIADAMREATGADIAFMNGGGVRSPGFAAGNVTYAQAFAVQPFGNSLVTLTLTARHLKDALEEQFAGCLGQSPTTTRIMLPSAGFRYTWDGSRKCGERIRQASLTTAGGTETIVADGAISNAGRAFRVTVNSYMADGGDGYSTFASVTERHGGPQDIDALVGYLAGFRAAQAAHVPGARAEDAGTARIHRVGAGGPACGGGS